MKEILFVGPKTERTIFVSSSLIEYTLNKNLCHICSLPKATSWNTYTY